MIVLVELHGDWYQVADGSRVDLRTMQFFNKVVEVENNVYNVIKNRESRDGTGLIDMLKMKLFANGKTLVDLPLFINDPYDKNLPRSPLQLGLDENNNLVTYSVLTDDFDPRN